MRSLSQSSTSDSNHPTREGPSCTRLGNLPAASSRAICAGEYRTFSRTCLFDNIRITMLPVGRRCNASVSQGATSITLPVAACVNPDKYGGSRVGGGVDETAIRNPRSTRFGAVHNVRVVFFDGL